MRSAIWSQSKVFLSAASIGSLPLVGAVSTFSFGSGLIPAYSADARSD
jgi:hypothetical protein